MLGGQPTGRGRIYKDMMDNKQHSTKLGGGHEPLKNGHPCKTLTSVSTMSVSTMSVFTMLMSTMGGRGCVASGGRKRWN